MNKKLKKSLFALGLAVCSIGAAQATPYVWADLYDPSDIVVNAGTPGLPPYTHNLTDGAHGFRPGIDTITSASLTFWLYDDNLFGDSKWGDSQESVKFNFDGSGWTAPQTVNGFGLNLGWLDDFLEQQITFNSLSALLSDGFLNVSLKAATGDFKFDKSLLLAYGNSAKVPEPATLALLGAGLLGMALVQRRRRQSTF